MKREEREIRALISLLGDEDRSIRKIARQKLVEYGNAARTYLNEVAYSDAEGRVRIEAQRVLAEMRLQRLQYEFAHLKKTDEMDLERGCFLLAQIEYPNLDVQKYVGRIDRLASEVRNKVSSRDAIVHFVNVINHVLFQVHGFRGDVQTYYDPKNTFINKVIDRRLGIPITLSSLYMFIAKRLGVPVHGVGAPGHFLMTFSYKNRDFYIDAFSGGQVLSREHCVRFIESMGYPFNDSYLRVAKPRDILLRMMRNLLLIYRQSNDREKLAQLEKFVQIFEPQV